MDVIVFDLRRQIATHQHGFDDPVYPRLAQFIGQLVQVGLAPQNQILLGLLDERKRNRLAAVKPFFNLKTGFRPQCIDQPGLAESQLPDCIQGISCEWLSCGFCMLGEEAANFLLVKIAHT